MNIKHYILLPGLSREKCRYQRKSLTIWELLTSRLFLLEHPPTAQKDPPHFHFFFKINTQVKNFIIIYTSNCSCGHARTQSL